MYAPKSQMFFGLKQNIFSFGAKPIDKEQTLCLNDFIILYKDVDGKSAFLSFAAERRRLVRAGAKKIGSLLPELVL